MVRTGTIVSFHCEWGSGLATLIVENQHGERDYVFCDNAVTVRALQAAFPDEEIILRNHCVNVEVLRGKTIEYQTGALGLLESFAPLEAEIEI